MRKREAGNDREKRESNNKKLKEAGRLEKANQELGRELARVQGVQRSLEENMEAYLKEMKEVREVNSVLQSKLQRAEMEKRDDGRRKMSVSAQSERADNLKTIQTATVQVDSKLEKLHGLISELTAKSRIMIDEANNVLSDDPLVEGNIFEVKQDISHLNRLAEEVNREDRSRRAIKTYDLGSLENINAKKDGDGSPEKLKTYIEKQAANKQKKSLFVPMQKPEHSEVSNAASLRKPAQKTYQNTQEHPNINTDMRIGSDYSSSVRETSRPGTKNTGQRQPVPFVKQATERSYPIPKLSMDSRAVYTQTNPLLLNDFMGKLSLIKQEMVQQVVEYDLEDAILQIILDMLILFNSKELSMKRNIKFLKSLLVNENISLLQDATNNGQRIEEELVMYIKRIQNSETANKLDYGNLVLEKNRMTKDDSMATNHLKKSRSSWLTNSPGKTKKEDPEERSRNAHEAKLISPEEANPNLQMYKEKYINKLRKEKNGSKLKNEGITQTLVGFGIPNHTKRAVTKRVSTEAYEYDHSQTTEHMIRRLFEHLMKDRTDVQKYHKYPFKSVEEISSFIDRQGEMEKGFYGDEAITSYEYFKKKYIEIIEKHKGCGVVCPHLVRFYTRIGFNPHAGDQQFTRIPVHIIDRIIFGEMDELL